MYRRILVAVENSAADRTILDHVRQLATLTNAEILLVHVADGWAARHFNDLQLRESEEIKADRAYLAQLVASLPGLKVTTEERQADLLAMSTHGHRFLNDLIRGTTVSKVRHMVKVPVLLLRAQ
jgi:manganese transport protein